MIRSGSTAIKVVTGQTVQLLSLDVFVRENYYYTWEGYVYCDDLTEPHEPVEWRAGASSQYARVSIKSTGAIQLKYSGTEGNGTITSAAGLFSTTAWNRIRISIRQRGTNLVSLIVSINGIAVLSFTDALWTTNTVDSVVFGHVGSGDTAPGSDLWMDDVRVFTSDYITAPPSGYDATTLAETQQPLWRFFLAISADMSILGELINARNIQLNLLHNRPGSCSFTLPITDPLALIAEPIRTCVIAMRDGVVQWSGPIWPIDESGGGNTCTISCVGWMELLNRRIFRTNLIRSQIDDGVIISDILAHANGTAGISLPEYTDALSVVHTAPSLTFITMGTINYGAGSVALRNTNYAKDASLGQEIQTLTEIENGCDIYLQPETRRLEIYRTRMVDRPNVRFGYNMPPYNLSDAGRQIDPSQQVNFFRAIGTGPSGEAEDEDSQEYFCLLEETGSLSNVADSDTLLKYAGAEVILRKNPRQMISVTPFKWTPNSSIPQPLVDYEIGDKVYVSASHGRMQFVNQAVRVFGMNFTIDDNGTEILQALQVTPT